MPGAHNLKPGARASLPAKACGAGFKPFLLPSSLSLVAPSYSRLSALKAGRDARAPGKNVHAHSQIALIVCRVAAVIFRASTVVRHSSTTVYRAAVIKSHVATVKSYA